MPDRRRTRLLLLTLAGVAVSVVAGTAVGRLAASDRVATARTSLALASGLAPETIEFGRDVRPILARSCLPCHGFDPSTREMDLRLDTFEGATAIRGRRPAAIVPGDPEASLLLDRVTAHDPRDRMPPEGDPLTADEIAILRAWIAGGADYEAHWSLLPVRPHEPPPVADPAWAAHPLDAFIRARLDAADLEPVAGADRRTLLRRLSFDLTGLPPTPEELEAFLADPGSDAEATARQVDRLLASPHFGERWARHWLDLVRYAETYGHEFDYPIRDAWRYRDYVIRAFNADVPYDRFVTEHVAGDLLAPPRRHPEDGTNESILATGFWWLSQGTHGPTDVRLDEAERIDNQIDVFSKAFLATTVACARCHDHKFDPITTAEYYGLAGYLQSSRRQEAYLDPGGRIAAAVDALRTHDTELRTQRTDAVHRAVAAARAELPAMVDAARAVRHGTPAPGEPAPMARDRRLADFDGDDYGDWTVTGDAFGPGPTAAGPGFLAGEGTAVGRAFANSHVRPEDGDPGLADRRIGRLASPTFTVEHDFLHARVGGGRHPGRTELRVIAGDRVVHAVTGHDSVRLRPVHLDLRAIRGQTAHIELVDEATGPWGNIRVDALVLSDRPRPDVPRSRSVAAVADERGLDADRLTDWVAALDLVDPGDAHHVAAGWITPVAENAADALPAAPTADPLGPPGAWRQTWFATGWAFDAIAAAPGDLHAPGEHDAIVTTAGPDSGALSRSLQGTLRSPTFEITEPWLHTRARGTGRLRVIIDGYHLDEFNALLFEGAMKRVDRDAWHWVAHDLSSYVGHRAHYEIIDDRPGAAIAVDAMRWSASADAPPPTTTPAEIDHWLLASGLAALPANADAAAARAAFATAAASVPAPPRALAMTDGTAEDERVFIRGDHRQLGDVAPRGFVAALLADADAPLPPPSDHGSGREQLAEMLLDPANPMLARVLVNRVWHHLMGRGLVATVDDFGLLGEPPTHPELLDHLAHRLRSEFDWSVKRLVREIVTSRTYALGGGPPDSLAAAADPTNRLWSHRPPRRLDGESIRDAILLTSGRLDRTMHGAPVPVHLTAFMNGRGRPGGSGPLDGAGRRSIYLEVRRNFLDPMMQAFDAPVPHSTMGRRTRSNVPAQSLILLNDPFVHQQARVLADRVRSEVGPDAADRIDRLFALALLRPPTADERAAMRAFLADPGETDDPLAELAHIVFNLKEWSFLD